MRKVPVPVFAISRGRSLAKQLFLEAPTNPFVKIYRPGYSVVTVFDFLSQEFLPWLSHAPPARVRRNRDMAALSRIRE
jgi:hypothetical protein